MMHFVVRNIELVLSAAGVLVILLVTVLFSGVAGAWRVAAVTATMVGLLHGLIFWVVRRRQRLARAQAIHDIREMLKDVVNNQLSSALLSAQMMAYAGARAAELSRLRESLLAASEAVDSLSEESLGLWGDRYAVALQTLRRASAPTPER